MNEMTQDHREFYRLDVNVSYFIKPLLEVRQCLQLQQTSFADPMEEGKFEQLDQKLNRLFAQQKYIDNGGVELFAVFQQKLDLLEWLLKQSLMQKDHILMGEYEQKMQQNVGAKMPELDEQSKIYPLLKAMYLRLDDYIHQMNEVFERRLQHDAFISDKHAIRKFDAAQYMNGLPGAAQKGNWIANVLVVMLKKLNLFEYHYAELKEANKFLADFLSWNKAPVNLAAGGFALQTTDAYQVGDRVCSIFVLDDHFIQAEAECVYQNEVPQQNGKRTAFKFTNISAEHQAEVVRFLTTKELENRA